MKIKTFATESTENTEKLNPAWAFFRVLSWIPWLLKFGAWFERHLDSPLHGKVDVCRLFRCQYGVGWRPAGVSFRVVEGEMQATAFLAHLC